PSKGRVGKMRDDVTDAPGAGDGWFIPCVRRQRTKQADDVSGERAEERTRIDNRQGHDALHHFLIRPRTSGQNSSHRFPATRPSRPSALRTIVWPRVVALGGSRAFSITLLNTLPA